MKAFKIYLTKSSEVASLIADGYKYRAPREEGSIGTIVYGNVDGCDMIPNIYKGENMFFCLAEIESDHQAYEIEFA
ncbi:MAG TPA: hypothetical protein H9761_17145 [Candidatus Eisenbergiella merdavium]|uniref:Uncharacterized protein n=1 Tax=Candidatus Eisenbergiella merdavium TaxID=2838551 RepID=A0A9D2SSC8_9FIRM|nr:hypothetical protein [Candidatus Eisenbergiella merdavium]